MNAITWRLVSFLGRLARRTAVVAPQTVLFGDPFGDTDRILDLGGGGEGVIGQLRGAQVTAIDLRQSELDEAPEGPTKLVADARALPFAERSFDAATAFFFLMYVASEDRLAVLREAYRVLVPGGRLYLWDAVIASPGRCTAELVVVPVRARLPRRTIRTAYGVRWRGREMTSDEIAALARGVGFDVAVSRSSRRVIRLVLVRPAEP